MYRHYSSYAWTNHGIYERQSIDSTVAMHELIMAFMNAKVYMYIHFSSNALTNHGIQERQGIDTTVAMHVLIMTFMNAKV